MKQLEQKQVNLHSYIFVYIFVYVAFMLKLLLFILHFIYFTFCIKKDSIVVRNYTFRHNFCILRRYIGCYVFGIFSSFKSLHTQLTRMEYIK